MKYIPKISLTQDMRISLTTQNVRTPYTGGDRVAVVFLRSVYSSHRNNCTRLEPAYNLAQSRSPVLLLQVLRVMPPPPNLCRYYLQPLMCPPPLSFAGAIYSTDVTLPPSIRMQPPLYYRSFIFNIPENRLLKLPLYTG